MSIAYPPAIDVCEGAQEDDNNDNGICHLIGKNGLPLCGRVCRGVIRTHPTNPLRDPCASCGCRRCVECARMFVFNV